MKQTYEIRESPKLAFVLDNDHFEIFDLAYPKNNGVYLFEKILNVDFNQKKTNWLISSISYILPLFLNGLGEGGNYRDQANLRIQFTSSTVKIWVHDDETDKIQKIKNALLERKPR